MNQQIKYCRLGDFHCEKYSLITFNGEKQTGEIFSSVYKWSKFILSSGHSNENKGRQKFDQSILPAKIPDLQYNREFQVTVYSER